MRLLPWQRVAWELMIGALAIIAAAAVIGPVFFVVNLIYRSGLFNLMFATVAAGVVLLFYQVRLRPALRDPAMRAAAGIAEALRGGEPPTPEQLRSASAFRIWGGVPTAALRATLHKPAGTTPLALTEALCSFVQSRADEAPTLTWALSEVGGDRYLLLQEPEQAGEPMQEMNSAMRTSQVWEESFHHLWSANGPASYEEPVAFATVLVGQAVAGKESELHKFAIGMAERVAALPDVSGVEVLTSDTHGNEAPYVLWLAAGRERAVRRQVYLALEPASAGEGLATAIDRFDLIACDAYAALEYLVQSTAENR